MNAMSIEKSIYQSPILRNGVIAFHTDTCSTLCSLQAKYRKKACKIKYLSVILFHKIKCFCYLINDITESSCIGEFKPATLTYKSSTISFGISFIDPVQSLRIKDLNQHLFSPKSFIKENAHWKVNSL